MADFSLLNVTDPSVPFAGWVSSSRDRGTIDILWSCCFTIFLSVWVATSPNAVAPNEGTWQRLQDKVLLALMAVLGPDFLFGIAAGQFSSAWRSVKAFKRDKHLCKGGKWTLAHGFLADMGGIHLTSPDYEKSFPITAAQLHYLVFHGHLEFPNMEEMIIDERSTVDILSRLLSIWQALWFSVAELERVRMGLPMTTLELTALSFVVLLLFTELLWFRKPSLMKPRSIPTKDNKTIADIRQYAKSHTHPNLEDSWYRTPLDFIDKNVFQFDNHWLYYNQILRKTGFSLSRSITSEPWDRVPCDTFTPMERSIMLPSSILVAFFNVVFLLAWDFFYPTASDQLVWRVVSAIYAGTSFIGMAFYFVAAMDWHRENDRQNANNIKTTPIVTQGDEEPAPEAYLTMDLGRTFRVQTGVRKATTAPVATVDTVHCPSESLIITELVQLSSTANSKYQGVDEESLVVQDTGERQGVSQILLRLREYLSKKLDRLRNISPDKDPRRAVRLRVTITIGFFSALYTLCRMCIYVEDFAALREQPIGIYITVNRFVPFLGD